METTFVFGALPQTPITFFELTQKSNQKKFKAEASHSNNNLIKKVISLENRKSPGLKTIRAE